MEKLERVFALELDTSIPINDSYIQAYPHLIKYFSGISELQDSDVAIGAHMVYGWMPTILRLNKGDKDPQQVVDILQAVNEGKADLSVDEFSILKQYINNSVVGASKVLHFIAPELYPIWDSKLFQFTHMKKPRWDLVNSVHKYIEYRSSLLILTEHAKFPALHQSVNRKLGYPVSNLRALELVMFLARGTKVSGLT